MGWALKANWHWVRNWQQVLGSAEYLAGGGIQGSRAAVPAAGAGWAAEGACWAGAGACTAGVAAASSRTIRADRPVATWSNFSDAMQGLVVVAQMCSLEGHCLFEALSLLCQVHSWPDYTVMDRQRTQRQREAEAEGLQGLLECTTG